MAVNGPACVTGLHSHQNANRVLDFQKGNLTLIGFGELAPRIRPGRSGAEGVEERERMRLLPKPTSIEGGKTCYSVFRVKNCLEKLYGQLYNSVTL